MRKTTKVLFGSAAVLATAALVQVATPATADAAAIEDSKITVDAATQTVTINKDVLGDGNNRQIYFGIPKVSVKDGKGTVTTAAKWDVYDTTTNSNDLTISLASLKNTADNYIQIKGSADVDPVTILIPKAEKYKAAFDPTAANALTVTNAKKDSSGTYPAYNGTIEYRTQYGSWEDTSVTGNPFAAYQEQGATIYMRVPASSTTDLAPVTDVTYTMKKKKATDATVNVAVKKAASFASAEFKVSVKKRGDGPKVSVDFVKSTLSIPAKCIYRVVDIDALGTGDFIGAGTSDAVSNQKEVKSLSAVTAGETFIIEQKQAKDATKKKMESKVAQLMVTRPADPTITEGTISETSNSCVGCKVNGDVTISRSDDFKTLKFENTSDKVYQVYLKGDFEVTDPKAKWNDIKAKKVTTKGTTNGTYSIKLPDADKQIWIRVKGDAKTATLSSNALPLGNVKYDKDAAAVATANAKITTAVEKLTKAAAADATKSDAVKPANDKSKVVLPKATAPVSYEWASSNTSILKNDGTLAATETLADQEFSGEGGTATVTLTATVKAENGTNKTVTFEVTVKKTTSGEGDSTTSTYTIEKVAKGVES